MKIIISCGMGKLHFHETARAAALGGADVQFIAGWIPGRGWRRLVDAIGRILGERSLANRMQLRVVNHPRVTMRSNALGDFAGNAVMRSLKRFFPSGDLAGMAFGIYGATSRKWLHDANIFHVRSGAGQGGAIRTARRNGMRVLTDHSIAHPAFMDEVLGEEHRRHGLPFKPTAGDGLWSRVLLDCHEADRLLVNSDFVKRTFIEKGFVAERIDVAYLGVREQFYSVKSEYSITGPVRLLFTGNFDIRKGVATLLDSIRILRTGGLDVRLRLIGNLQNPTFLRESDWEFFTHTPFVPPAELIPALGESDMFVFPTLIEGSSRSAMEAAAAGLPIITTRNCGLPLEEGNEVVFVPLSDSHSLAETIARLSSDEPLRRALGQNAATVIQRSYTWHGYGQRLQQIYTKLLN